MIKEITDIAAECGVEFQVVDQEYQDGSIKAYQFNWMQFLTLEACLKFAEHFKAIWAKDQEIYALDGTMTKMLNKIDKLEEKDEEWKSCFETWKVTTAKTISDNTGYCEQLLNYENEACTMNATIRSLRSKLGHAKGKIKRLSK